MRAKLALAILLAFAACLPQAFADPASLQPRVPVDKRQYPALPEATELQHVVVKLHEGTAVRLRGGVLTVVDRDERSQRSLNALGLSPATVERDVAEIRRLVAGASNVQGLRRLFSQAEDVLAARRARGEARGNRQLADLDLYYKLPVTPGTRAGEVAPLLAALNALSSVEIAYAQSFPQPASVDARPENDPSPPGATPNFQSQQGYLNASNASPPGIDAVYAWTQAGGAGLGVKIVDIEGGWRTTHEDMPTLFHTGGTQINDLTWRNHGTAVLGEMVSKNNGFGVTGIVHQAQAGYESIGSQDTPDALINAGNAVGEGGVVLIELHDQGPTSSSPCTCNFSQCYFIPMEFFQAEFDAIANLTANGVVVVEAAGNGSTNLDDAVYGTIFQRNVRDSGAILVAASNSFDRNPTCWTNWGSRIDLHGWGGNVVTMGYGNLASNGTEDSWYTNSFSGTSSASPIVTGAAASVQGHALATKPEPLDPRGLRNLLVSTGTPYTGTKNIGNFPNLRTAFEVMDIQALDYYTVAPCRAVDTRSGSPLASGVTRTFPIAGVCGVPASAKAVAVNLTAINATASGNVALWPANLAKPITSNINFSANQPRANLAIVLLATSGAGTLAAQGSVAGSGTVHMLIDVAGYYVE